MVGVQRLQGCRTADDGVDFDDLHPVSALPIGGQLAAEAAALVRTALTDEQCKQLHDGLEQAMADPWSWPASDSDDFIRQIVLSDLIAHK
ncbi:hypothetical protein GCM10010495_64110 [Kitasatospora herbaricolor]|nr:hypothetical protein GCM10010495_64110 [Kitasatospora herbaricolor]